MSAIPRPFTLLGPGVPSGSTSLVGTTGIAARQVAYGSAANVIKGSNQFAFLESDSVQLSSAVANGIQLYNTADQTTNYERLEALWSGNTAIIRTILGGTGTSRNLSVGAAFGSTIYRGSSSTAGAISFSTGGASSLASQIGFSFVSYASTATSGTNIGLSLTPTYNQASGTAANTDLLINRTETAVGSGTQNFIQLQVGGSNRVQINNNGSAAFLGGFAAGSTSPQLSLVWVGGNFSRAAWGTMGMNIGVSANTITDTSTAGSGVVASAVANSFAQPTFAAANSSVTTTDAATLYIAAAPTAGTNMTITNAYSLWIDAGDMRYDGTVSAAAAVASTHKVRVNCNGTTYYLLMTTVP